MTGVSFRESALANLIRVAGHRPATAMCPLCNRLECGHYGEDSRILAATTLRSRSIRANWLQTSVTLTESRRRRAGDTEDPAWKRGK